MYTAKTSLFWRTIVYAVLILGAAVFILPFIYMILTTFVDNAYTLPRPDEVFSVIPNLDNYETVWAKNHFFRYFLNSLLIAGVSMFGSLFHCRCVRTFGAHVSFVTLAVLAPYTWYGGRLCDFFRGK